MTPPTLLDRLLSLPETVWGDGFAEEGWSDLLSVRTWDDLDADLLARFYPGLSRGGPTVPAIVVDHLRAGILARARRLATRHGAGAVPPLRSFPPDAVEVPLRSVVGCSSSSWRGLSDFMRRVTRGSDPDEAAEERCWLLYLDDVVWQIEGDLLDAARPAGTALFAFLTAIHPAYLWPAAAVSHERDATAAWLGLLSRGRPALMTEEVAGFLVQSIMIQDGHLVLRDHQIARFATMAAPLHRLLAGAEGRLRGELKVFRRGPGTHARHRPPRAVPLASAWDEPDPGFTPL